MVNARSVMTTNVLSVQEQTSVEEAIRLLVEKGVSGLPVVDQGGRLLGVVSEKDLLPLLYDVSGGLSRKTVSEYMTRNVVSYGPNDSLKTICDELVKRSFRRVPIVEDGRLVGIVSRRDILAYILEFRRQLDQAR